MGNIALQREDEVQLCATKSKGESVQKEYWVIAFYKFISLDNPQLEVERHKQFFLGKEMSGRIYFSTQGVNAQLSGVSSDAQEYLAWIKQDERFSDIEPCIHLSDQNAFPRMTVKVRQQLVALDQEVDLTKRGTYVSSAQWRSMLESQEKYLMIDVRNDYEWDLGHFEGMQRPSCQTFRQFPNYLRSLIHTHDPNTTKVMMCCTGGIRCELYSALLKEKGFKEVYQLRGGILRYAKEEKGKHWKGKLFVFDDRLAVTVNEEEKSCAGKCLHCQALVDRFYNCANMDCNELFLCCSSCLEKFAGCCKQECRLGQRVRPYDHQLLPKPFRKWYHYIREEERKGNDSYAAVSSSEGSSKTS